jgi:hypothetical protein
MVIDPRTLHDDDGLLTTLRTISIQFMKEMPLREFEG